MIIYLVLAILVLMLFAPVIPLVRKEFTGKKAKYTSICNIVSFFAICIISTVFLFIQPALASEVADAAANAAATTDINTGLGYLAAALVVGISTIGAGLAVASAAAAAIGVTGENPKLSGKVLIFVALGEAIPLYALLVAFLIINKL